jgi:hypothetical protein
MALKKHLGTRMFIGAASLPYTRSVSASTFSSTTWLRMNGLITTPSLTTDVALLTQELVDEVVPLYGKGIVNLPMVSASFAPDYTDAGQNAFRNAINSRCGNRVWPFRVEWDADCASESTVTISNANPGVVTWNAHGLVANTPVVFSTTGTLPTGLLPGITYYVLAPATNTFTVALTPGGAAIATTAVGTGTHTARAQVPDSTDMFVGLPFTANKPGGGVGDNRQTEFMIQPTAQYFTV